MPGAGLLALLLASTATAQGAAPSHPLDGLSSTEHWIARDVLRDAGRLEAPTFFVQLLLDEPAKDAVWSWRPGQPFDRQALAVLRQEGRTVEARIDLARRRLVSWETIDGAQTMLTETEVALVGQVLLADERVLTALARRGIEDASTVGCWGMAPGLRPRGLAPDRRVARGQCADRRGSYATTGRRIEGLDVLVDLGSLEIVHFADVDAPVHARPEVDVDAESLGAPARDGDEWRAPAPRYRLQGRQVTWGPWQFHFRIDPRRGLVLSTLTVADGAERRPVLYQASLSELYVPYMDPAPGWADRLYLDLGEYSSDGLAETLEPGLDCPFDAAFFDDVAVTENGQPRRRRRTACLFERHAATPAWRRGVEGGERVDGRTARELVLRMAATIGTYDYLLDWIFREDASLVVRASASGALEVRTVGLAARRGERAEEGGPQGATGRLVAERLLAVHHDHWFNFRLDFDVDGPANRFVETRLVPQRLAGDGPRRSLWTTEEHFARREDDARFGVPDHDAAHGPVLWRVQSSTRRNAVGQPTSYEIRGHATTSLLAADDPAQRRAGFTAAPLWVTAHAPRELYAAGDYPTLGPGDDGLPRWVRRGAPLLDRDLVVWFTLGFHHVPRAEDWPVMPVATHEFELRPFDFYSANPALRPPHRAHR